MKRSGWHRRTFLAVLPAVTPVGRWAAARTAPPTSRTNDEGAITDVAGVKAGHFTHTRRPTGCTVVLVEQGAVAGVDVRGAAPGTRETDLLDPANTVGIVHAVVLTGGSAFGLDSAAGVMRFLEARGVGFAVRAARVPIVPAAVLFDLDLGDGRLRPDAAAGHAAAAAARPGPLEEGNVGAGAGATVGKMWGPERAMKGGLGTASLRIPGGGVVGAVVAVNAFGDVVDPRNGGVVAGARSADGKRFEPAGEAILRGAMPAAAWQGRNTTIGVVATDVRLTKAEATQVARAAHAGLARTIVPVHTPFDGDTLFVLSTGPLELSAAGLRIGALAAEAVARAVLRAVRLARGLPGLPAASDLGRS